MRCLNCGKNGLPLNSIHCTQCNCHLPSLMRDCLQPGTILNNETYRIDYPLGRGGFGITYRAFDIPLERAVAIKEFFPQEHVIREATTEAPMVISELNRNIYERGLKRFLREGSLLARLADPGVVQIYNGFEEKGTAYLVMELIRGKTLRDELKGQPEQKLSSDRVENIMSQLVAALTVVHSREVYHLDLAPDNVMITPEGRVILLDFGASRQGLGTETTQAFKANYAPPEVINGNATEMGPQSDLFELGMMLHEMLTGELPPNSIARLASIATQAIDPAEPINSQEPWCHLVRSAIRLRLDERPSSVKAWWENTNPPPPPPEPPEPPELEKIQIPAGFSLRLVAYLIDIAILITGSGILQIAFGLEAIDAGEYFAELLGIYIFVNLIYSPVMESSPWQGTVGKKAMGIMVTDKNQKRLEYGKASRRHFYKIFSYLTLFIGFFMAGFTKEKRTLHDMIAKCKVIRRN